MACFVDPAFIDASVPVKLRQRHSTTLLTNGSVLITGGQVGAAADKSAERYDPVRGTTSVVANLAEARSNHSATLLEDGRVLLAGGTGSNGDLASTEPICRMASLSGLRLGLRTARFCSSELASARP